ncbi:MAG TPA: AI-2E family transporter [Syntrophomonas sp.]|nr:AI-2E family transporter [Syntrophomonas sp.]
MAIATLCFAYLVRDIIYTFLAGALLAYLLFRPVALVEKLGLDRIWGIVIIYLLAAAAAGLLLWLAVPRLLKELNEFAALLPAYTAQVQDISGQIHNYHLPGQLDQIFHENTAKIEKYIFNQLKGIVNGIYVFFSKAMIIVFAPILAVYIINDWEKIKAGALNLLTPSLRRDTETLTGEIDTVCIGYLKGHLLVSALVGLATGLAAMIIGVDFALAIGIISGISNLIPYFGPILGGIPAIALALTQSWQDGAYMAAAIIVIQMLESNLLTPKIVGQRLGMSPLFVVFALMVGGELLGVLGMLVALPVAATLRIIISFVYLKLVE